jgi:hypothetical protein
MAARSAETRKTLRELDRQLGQASVRHGVRLHWSAQERVVLAQISSILDRKSELFGLYSEAPDTKTKLKLSAELRLLEQAAARLVREIKSDLPSALASLRTTKAQRAANTRWARAAN